ncbi:M20 family metallopeptidase [Clostridiaceae bacterium 35-E11]
MSILAQQMVKDIEDQVIAWRRELHQYPELGMKTIVTEKIIVRALKEIGIEEIITGVGGEDCHGVVAIIRGELPGKCLGIRADCDALPIKEETGLPFASKNEGCMHACGHDGHTAMGLGIAKIIFENRDKLRGTVKMIFQPGEEGEDGAEKMIRDGVMENPKIDAMISQHSGTSRFQEINPGQIGWTSEPSSFCITGFKATFHGKSAHVAEPHLGVDPIMIACHAVTQMQTILSREIMPCKPVICAVTMFHAGEKNNIIPSSCEVEGSIRSNEDEAQQHYYERMKEIFEGTAKAMRGSAEVEITHKLATTDNDPEMIRKFLVCAERAIGKENVIEVKLAIPGGEDFSAFTKLVPCVYYYHGGNFGDERDFPQHCSKFDLNEETLWSGVATITQFAFDWQTV